MKRGFGFLALALSLLLVACGQQAGTAGSPTPSPSPTASVLPSTGTPTPTPSPTLTPTTTPTPAPTVAWPPAGFTTGPSSGGSATLVDVTAVRVGSHDGYDRFVLEFTGSVPAYTVTIQSGVQFTEAPKGGTVTLEGANGVLVTLQHIDWTAYKGPTTFLPRFPYLRQALLVQNFEGTQQWALGIAGSPAVRVFTLSSPFRLVIDVTAR